MVKTSDDDRKILARRLTTFLLSRRSGLALALPFIAHAVHELLEPLFDRDPSLADQREEVRRMLKALAAKGSLENATIFRLGGRNSSSDQINLLTLHSAKGCEYDAVVMVGLDQGMFPWKKDGAAEILEGRRLFYVGLTRAKDEVHMLYSGWYEHNGQRYAYGPSIYLVELAQRLQTKSAS